LTETDDQPASGMTISPRKTCSKASRRRQAVLADRAYDNNDLRQTIADIGAQAVIPSTRSRKRQIPHDAVAYKIRNRIERWLNKLKHFRRFATRYNRRADLYLAFVHLAAIAIWLR
jgi:transposase